MTRLDEANSIDYFVCLSVFASIITGSLRIDFHFSTFFVKWLWLLLMKSYCDNCSWNHMIDNQIILVKICNFLFLLLFVPEASKTCKSTTYKIICSALSLGVKKGRLSSWLCVQKLNKLAGLLNNFNFGSDESFFHITGF